MNASDIAYLVALVEKAPSSYPRRKALIEELQEIYRKAQAGVGYGVYRVAIAPTFHEAAIIEVKRS